MFMPMLHDLIVRNCIFVADRTLPYKLFYVVFEFDNKTALCSLSAMGLI